MTFPAKLFLHAFEKYFPQVQHLVKKIINGIFVWSICQDVNVAEELVKRGLARWDRGALTSQSVPAVMEDPEGAKVQPQPC